MMMKIFIFSPFTIIRAPVAFSIFNKTGPGGDSKPSSLESGTTVAKTAAGAKPAAARVAPPGVAPEMMAYDVQPLPLMQEVAVLYAAEYLDAAQMLLRQSVQDKTPNPQSWLMLLDLYKLRGLKKEFEDLAMTYTVKFERSPPTWSQQLTQPETRKESRQASDFFALPSKDGLLADIKKLTDFANKLGSVRIDVGKIKTIKPEEAGALASALHDFRKRALPLRFNNANQLIDLLKKSISEHPSKDYANVWVLLFELYQRQGMQTEFEDLGLEYAMGYEMSPPSWEAVPVPPPDQDNDAGTEAATATAGFPLRGVIALDDHNQLALLLNHAAGQKEVHINMSGLQRIDFSAVGLFFDTLAKIHHAGKKIILVDINELLYPLLEAFGASRFAVLLRHKA